MIGHKIADALLGGWAAGEGDSLQVFGHKPVQAKDLCPDPVDLFLLRRGRVDHRTRRRRMIAATEMVPTEKVALADSTTTPAAEREIRMVVVP